MKALFLFLLGVVAGGVGLYVYLDRRGTSVAATSEVSDAPPAASGARPADAGERLREAARDAKEATQRKLREWDLTPENVSRELRETGRVIRDKSREVGGKLARTSSDARIVTVIKSKYALDDDLSALDIAVTSQEGRVALSGTAKSADQIARAIQIALETEGVVEVTSTVVATP